MKQEQSAAVRPAYPSDLREGEWAILEPLVPAVKPGGRPARHSRREIVNAILYVVRGGNQWRAMPPDRPHGKRPFTLSGSGATTAPGSVSTRRCASGPGGTWDGRPPPAPRSWTASRSRPVKGGPTRLRRPPAGERTQAASAGGYAGLRAQGGRLGRRCAGPRRGTPPRPRR